MARRGVITFLISTMPQVLCHLPGRHGDSHYHHQFRGPMSGHHHSLDLGVTGAAALSGEGSASRGENRSLPQPVHSHQFDELGHKPLGRESVQSYAARVFQSDKRNLISRFLENRRGSRDFAPFAR